MSERNKEQKTVLNHAVEGAMGLMIVAALVVLLFGDTSLPGE